MADDFDSYTRKIMSYSAALTSVGAVALAIITYRDRPDLFGGFVLGAVFSMLRWRLMIRELKKMARGSSGAGLWLRGFFIRYGLTGLIIGVSVASDAFSVITTVAGIFLVNAVIIGEQILTMLVDRVKGKETWE